jgi:arabinoxylan arabinofuranohydrolase
MISLDGDPETWSVPNLFEDNEIIKINGKYYYSFCSRDSVIAYMTSDEPFGTYSASRDIMQPPNRQLSTPDQNNHHCIFQFKGDTYIAYHASKVSQAMGLSTRYRSTFIDRAPINASGGISTITMSRLGVPPKGQLNPYVLNEAETIGIMGGIYTRAVSGAGNGMVVTSIDTGDWIALYGVDFGAVGAKKFTARARIPDTPADYVGAIELRLDPTGDGVTTNNGNLNAANTARIKDGEVIGHVKIVGNSGEYATVTVDLYKTVTGVHNLVFVFYSSLGVHPETVNPDSRHKNGFEFDQWQFF